MTEIKLHSGAVLNITLSPFAESKALYQAILEELKPVSFNASSDLAEVFKNLACVGFSSKRIEACLDVCFKRCTYDCGKGPLKIDKDTFEPVENREDYIQVCLEVIKENVAPFLKSLFAEYRQFMLSIPKNPA